MKQIRVIVKIKNNVLLSKREELKFSQSEMAFAIGIPTTHYCTYENLKEYPVKNGIWNKWAFLIADYLNMSPEEVFPEALSKITKNHSSFGIDTDQLESLASSAMTNPIKMIEAKQSKNHITNVINTHLTPREQMVINQRFGISGEIEKTLQEVADEMNCTVTRVRQIECKAIRKLRHPNVSKKLIILESDETKNYYNDAYGTEID